MHFMDALPQIVTEHLVEVRALCEKYSVRKLTIFGSAVKGTFDPEKSDIDLLVEFEEDAALSFASLFGFENAVAELVGIDVDVVINAKFRNPYFQEAVDESRELVYESSDRQVTV